MKKALIPFLASFVCVSNGFTADIIAVTWPFGVYNVNPTDGSDQYIGRPSSSGTNALAKDLAGRFYTTDEDGNLILLDPTDGSGTIVAELSLQDANINVPSMAFSPSGTLYVINRDGQDSLYVVDVGTGIGTLVGPTGTGRMQGLTFSPNGALYAWDIRAGLSTIDTATGVATDVNDSEGASEDIQSLAFSPEGVLYGAQYGLYTIDPTTGVPVAVSMSGLPDVRGMEFDTGPVLRLGIHIQESSVILSWTTVEDKTYQLQSLPEFSGESEWSNLGTAIPGDGGVVSITNPIVSTREFYRVTATP